MQAELLTGEALFPGSSDIDQLHLQLQLLGPLPASMATSFCGNPHNAQLMPLPTKPVGSLKVWWVSIDNAYKCEHTAWQPQELLFFLLLCLLLMIV